MSIRTLGNFLPGELVSQHGYIGQTHLQAVDASCRPFPLGPGFMYRRIAPNSAKELPTCVKYVTNSSR